MGDKTGIEWTDATWNPIRGCTRVSEGCRHCYAERVAARFGKPGEPYEGLAHFVNIPVPVIGKGITYLRETRWTGKVAFVEEHLSDPLRWKKPRRIFVNSMSDLFHEGVQDEWIDKIFAVMAASPQHVFQVLTKRPERMLEKLTALGRSIEPLERQAREIGYTFNFQRMPLLPWPIPNIWLGVSVEDQPSTDKRIPLLLKTPAAVRWISAEPLLGPVDFSEFLIPRPAPHSGGRAVPLNWVVAGGESGPGARPMHPDWARSLRDQCQAARVPYFFKQWGEWIPGAANGFTQWPEIDASRPILMPAHPGREGIDQHQVMLRVGKKAAGRLLDGREWSEYPNQGKA